MINMSRKKKEELPDYTVANMDVDGMPWNTKNPWMFPGKPGQPEKKHPMTMSPEEEVSEPIHEPMSKKETRFLAWTALKASLMVAGVFGLAGFLFILFCVYIWFR